MKVTAKVLEHVRGEKLRVFKFKPKRGYKRRTGHRQELTRIEVTEIGLGAATGRRRSKAPPGRRRHRRRGAAEATAAPAPPAAAARRETGQGREAAANGA